EHYLFMYKALYGLDYTVLRYPNVYGPRQDPHGEAGVVAIFTGRMLRGEPVTIYGSGEQERDFVYVGDCARANLIAAVDGHSGIFNLGWGAGTNINQIFSELKAITGYPRAANYGPPKAGETYKIFLDATLARRQMGWEPTVSLTEGMRQTVDYFRQNEVGG
ncbi:MAG: NAD-dependent epimerase/dehydratase family protein, partial [Chloroflexi bacterium]|nr:NAD-dependent epimerase/dehydratase family protein [Chloroflexota bacterium]